MKIKVLKKFRDRHTGKIHKVDTVIEVTKDRFAEIQRADASLVEAVEEKTEDTATEEKAEETATEEKTEDTATEEKAEETATEEKAEETATEEKTEDTATEKKKPAKKSKTK